MFLDVIAALVFLLGFYFGYRRGFIQTIFDTLSFVIAILAALKLSPIVINVLNKSLNLAPSISFILGIVITFFLIMLLVRFVGKKLEDLFKAININFINKVSGGILQALFFAIVLSYAVGLLDKVNVVREETKQASLSYDYLMKLPEVSEKMFVALKPWFTEFWDATIKAMDSVNGSVEDNSSD